MKRILLLATTTGYQIRMFGEAAERLGVRLLFATDRCDRLDDPWWDGAVPVRFQHEGASIEVLRQAIAAQPIDGVLAVGDRPTVLAAHAARLAGVPGNPADAASAARDKRLTRERLERAGMLVPSFSAVPADADANAVAARLTFPVVVKPIVLSGSRGVMRADDPATFAAAFARLRRLLASQDVRALQDPGAATIQIEEYIEGREYAIEGVLEHGRLNTLAIFDKPDPLDGPFFEETLYVTPSRASASCQQAIGDAVIRAVRAIGLRHGPVHAECRVNDRGVFVLEVAARPIGGLCARALTFAHRDGRRAGLEELLLRHAVGEPLSGWERAPLASGVMMIPIPREGVYRGVAGIEDAGQVHGIDDVVITAKADQHLVPLPEGASYLGFIFARQKTPEGAEGALRAAHAHLRFRIDPALPLAR